MIVHTFSRTTKQISKALLPRQLHWQLPSLAHSFGMPQCAYALKEPLPPGIAPGTVVHDFMHYVNMTVGELERLLESKESSDSCTAIGNLDARHLARRVIELVEKVGEKRDDPHFYSVSQLYEADIEQMYQIAEFIRCHLNEAGNPDLIQDPSQRLALMHLGFDPSKAATST